jgi:hypothetical protein
MELHKSYIIEKTDSKGIKFKLLHPETDNLVYQIKERKQGITSSKTQFFISGVKHTDYISSIYPIDYSDNFTGTFQLEPNCNYTIEYRGLRYSLLFDNDTCTILGGVNNYAG